MPIPVTAVNQFVEEEGERVRHLVGMRCWCHGPDGQPDPNCDAHESGGWLYTNERVITGLVTDISQRRELMETGVFMPGDCVFSPLSSDIVSEGDKIIFTWPLPYGQGDPLQRGIGAADHLYYDAVRSIYCQDENGTRYTEGTDFRFIGKTIEWTWAGKPLGGIKPATGIRYTVKYMAYIEWLVFVPPVERISHGADIGAKVMLRKKHLVER